MVKIAGVDVGTVGFGLMGFTWRPSPLPRREAIAAMKMAVDRGAICWNGGTFYGPPNASSLQLLNAYFTQYPEDADKVMISIKGPARGDKESITSTVDYCLEILGGTKHLDLYQCARVDPRVPIEETFKVLSEYIFRGKLSGITLSEPSAEQIRRATAVHKVAFVEVEFSLFAQEPLYNGVAETCAELGVPLIAYSPLGRGFLTGQPQRADELEDGDVRKPFPRIQPGNFECNLKLAKAVWQIAEKKGCTPAQMALAWVLYQSGKPGMPEILPIPGSTTPYRVEENTTLIELTDAEFEALNVAVGKNAIVGARYPS